VVLEAIRSDRAPPLHKLDFISRVKNLHAILKNRLSLVKALSLPHFNKQLIIQHFDEPLLLIRELSVEARVKFELFYLLMHALRGFIGNLQFFYFCFFNGVLGYPLYYQPCEGSAHESN